MSARFKIIIGMNMEQNNDQSEFVDLSQVLNETDEAFAVRRSEEKVLRRQKIPAIYRLIFKLSGGLIKTEKQAMCVVVILIVLINALTYSLAFGGKSVAQKTGAAENAAKVR